MTQRTWKHGSSNSCTKLLYRLIYLNFSRIPQVIDRLILGIQKNRWSIFTGETKTRWLGQQKMWYKVQAAWGKMTVEQVGRKWQCATEAKAQPPAVVWGVIAVLRRWVQWCVASLLDTTTFTERKFMSSASQTKPDIYLRIPEQLVQSCNVHWMIFPQNFSS